MNKFYPMLTIAAAALASAAPASGQSLAFPELFNQAKAASAAEAPRREKADIPVLRRAAAKTADGQWSAWERLGTASFNQDLIDFWTGMCEHAGTTMPEFSQPFPVEERRSLTDDAKAELRLRNIFGGVDIVLPYDTRTGYFNTEPQSTGIPLDIPGYNENFMFTAWGFYYQSAKKIDIRSIFMLDDGDWGYNCGSSTLVMDGAQEVEFLLETNHFIPSTATELAVKVDRSSNVAWYRVVNNANFYASDLAGYFAKDPLHAPNPYFDNAGDSFTVTPWGMSDIVSGYYVIPFGADDRAIDTYKGLNVYYNYNYHNGYNAEWNVIGRGRMTEKIAYWGYTNEAYNALIVDGIPMEIPLVSTPEIEMTTDGSLLCVKNPFGPEHPSYGSLIENVPEAKSDDFYLVFDISDPSRVYANFTLTGMKDNGYGQTAINGVARRHMDNGMSQAALDSLSGVWGKLADNRLIMPEGSLWTSGYVVNSDFVLELPGYVDYDIKAEPSVTADGTAYNCLLNYVSSNIVSVDYALVPESYYQENRNFPERVPAGFVDASNGFSVRNVATNGASTLTLSIPEEEVGYGDWVLAAVGRDASGNTHSALFVPQVISKIRPLSEWRNAGTVKVCDGIAGSIYRLKPTALFTVDILENPDAEGVYLLPNYYQTAFASLGVNGTFDSEVADPFVLDLRGDYPMLTNSLSGARCTGDMMTGIEIPGNEESAWQLRVRNTCDYSSAVYGTITRGADGTIEKVDFSNSGLIVMVYESISGEHLGWGEAGQTWIDFTYDVATDPYIFDNWRPVGTITVTENIVSDAVSSGSESSCEAEIFAHPTRDGIYCIPEIFRGMPWAANDGWLYSGNPEPFVINAEDPAKVHVTTDYDGVRKDGLLFTGWLRERSPIYSGSIYLCLMANAIESGMLSGMDASMVDAFLGTFDAAGGEFNLDNCFATVEDGRFYGSPATEKFRVKFTPSSVEETPVSAAGVVSVEYYTVDGRRLASPADGITIRRTLYSDGRTATDKHLR